MSKIYVGDIGTVFDLDAQNPKLPAIDLTGYTLTVEFQKPDANKTIITRAAALKPASTTVVRYTTVTGDIDISGAWRIQLKAVLSGSVFYGETVTLNIYDRFA